MPTTPNMGMITPTDHGSLEVWDTVLDAVFALIDSHGHTTGQGVPIASAALRINADVAWTFGGTSFAVTSLKATTYTPVAAASVAGYAGALFVNSADNELYYRTIAGTNVKFTNGAALNFAAFVGGIGGDYSAVGALESYDDATRRYLFQQEGSPRPWAGLAGGNLDIYQQAASIVNRVRLQSPNALAASYALQLPPAIPGISGSVMTFTSATPSVATFLDPATFVRTSGIPGFSTSIQLKLNISASAGVPGSGNTYTMTGPYWTTTAQANPLWIPITVPEGSIITAYQVFWNKTTNAATTVIATINAYNSVGTSTGLTGASTQSNSANAPGVVVLTQSALTYTVPTNTTIAIGCSTNGVGAGDFIVGASVTYYSP